MPPKSTVSPARTCFSITFAASASAIRTRCSEELMRVRISATRSFRFATPLGTTRTVYGAFAAVSVAFFTR